MIQTPYFVTGINTGAVVGEPREEDVLMGRGTKFQYHPGNILYNDLVNNKRDRYFSTLIPMEKKSIIEEIVNRILQQGRFLQRDAASSCWVPISKERALTKVAHAIQYQQRKTVRDVERFTQPLSEPVKSGAYIQLPSGMPIADTFEEVTCTESSFDDLDDADGETQMLRNIQQWQQILKCQEENAGIAVVERAYISRVGSGSDGERAAQLAEPQEAIHVVSDEASGLEPSDQSALHTSTEVELFSRNASMQQACADLHASMTVDDWMIGCDWNDSFSCSRLDMNRSSSTFSLVSLDDDLDAFMANAVW